jgi:hypothetical protein
LIDENGARHSGAARRRPRGGKRFSAEQQHQEIDDSSHVKREPAAV